MLVSVIIPTFNRAAFVREAVLSVLAQRGVDFELIVVDDGSSDGTAELLAAEFGDSVRVLRSDNRGVSAARNLGARVSSGELLAFLDSDDLWLAEKLRLQVAFFRENPDASICQTEEVWLRHGTRVQQRSHQRKPSGWIFEPSLHQCLVGASSVVLRRSLFDQHGGFDESLPACEDYDLWLRIACHTQVWLLDAPLIIKRGGHADQLSYRHWGMDRFRVAALSKLLGQGRLTPEQRQATVRVLNQKCRILADGAAKRGRADEASRYSALAQVAA